MHTHRRKVAFAAAAAMLVTLVAGCGSDEQSEPGPAPEAAAPAVDPAAAPAQVRWQQFQGISLPISQADGPKQSSVEATGFAHSGQGAVLAAINTSVRIAVAPDAQWAQIVKASVAPGAGRDAFMVNRAQVKIAGGQTQDEFLPTVRGYTLSDYSPERATFEVITQYPDGSWLSTTESVIWRDGDWKLVVPDPNGQGTPAKSISGPPEGMTVLEEKK